MQRRVLAWTFPVAAAAMVGAALSPGCAKSDPKTEARLEASRVFTSKCAQCHGLAGNGIGPASANLRPKPRDYTDKQWQATVKDEEIEKTIVYGGAAVGKSPQMPAHPELSEKPLVVEALREKIRSFAQ